MYKTLIDKLPADLTIFAGGILAIAPILPEPHLVQKAMWLMDGTPLKPIDWFDIVMHGSFGILAVAVFIRRRERRAEAAASQPSDNQEDKDA